MSYAKRMCPSKMQYFMLFILLNLSVTTLLSSLHTKTYVDVDQVSLSPNDQGNIVPFGAFSGTSSWMFNLSEYLIDDYEEVPLTLESNTLYNFSVINNGSATFDVCLAINLTATTYLTQESSSTYSDDLLLAAGVPMWGDYDVWDTIDFSNQVSNGIDISAGTTKEFLLYLSDSIDPKFLDLTWLVILTGTTEPLNNTLFIECTEMDIENSSLDIQYTPDDQQFSSILPAGSNVILNMSTKNQEDLTKTILNESVSVNGSLTVIRWQKDLSGNLVRRTVDFTDQSNHLFVPEFENLQLDGTDSLGILINSNLGEVQLNWTFNSTMDRTLTYNSGILENSSLEFEIGEANQAWRVVSLGEVEYFDISFGNSDSSALAYWDISVDFFTLGSSDAPLFTLDSFGENQSEFASFFATSLNNNYEDTREAFLFSESPMHYWWAEHGIPNQNIKDIDGTHNLGFQITAQTINATSNLTCEIVITAITLDQFENGESMNVGGVNGLPSDEFKPFYVREFTFANYTQYRWELQSSTALIEVNKRLFCQDLDTYLNNMNNALISTPFNTLSLEGNITLEFDLSADFRNNDFLYVYLQNGSTLTEIERFDGAIPLAKYEYNISSSSASSLQIIFNLTSGSNGVSSGPILDNIRVSNQTDAVFFDDFNGVLEDSWTQVDNTDMDLLLWNIKSESFDYNTPAIDICYPNSMYTFEGYSVNPEIYNEFVKTELDYNPFVQHGNTGFIIYKASDNLLYQNFSMQVNQTMFSPQLLNDVSDISSNHQFPQVKYANYEYFEEMQSFPEFYEFYYIDFEPGLIYELQFTCNQTDVVLLFAEMFSAEGTTVSLPQHYGFFVINTTYQFQMQDSVRIYIKFDEIESGLTIRAQTQIVDDKDETIEDLDEAIDDLTETIDDLNGTIDDMTGTIDDMTGTIDDLTGTIDDLTGTIDDMEETLDNQEEEILQEVEEKIKNRDIAVGILSGLTALSIGFIIFERKAKIITFIKIKRRV